MYTRISASTTSHLIAEKNPLIFDVRDAASYHAAHVPNAIFLSDRMLKSAIKQTARDRPILVYCYHGNASQDIARLFSDFGFHEVYSLDGGFESWCREWPSAVSASPQQAEAAPQSLEAWLIFHHFTPTDLEAKAQGVTPLIKACQLGLADVAAELLAAGADVDAVDAHGNDALWAACFSGDLPTLKLLLAAGVSLDRANPGGNTALIYAASAGKTEVVDFLLQAGADATAQNRDGFTALDLAANLAVLRRLKPLSHISSPRGRAGGLNRLNLQPTHGISQ